MLITILPVIIIAMIFSTWMSGSTSKKIISNEIEAQMSSVLEAELGAIQNKLDNVSTTVDGKVYGVASIDLKLSTIQDIVNQIDPGKAVSPI